MEGRTSRQPWVLVLSVVQHGEPIRVRATFTDDAAPGGRQSTVLIGKAAIVSAVERWLVDAERDATRR